MISKHDGYPLLFDIDTAIEVLEDQLSGAEEDRGHDTRTTELIRLFGALGRVLGDETTKRATTTPTA